MPTIHVLQIDDRLSFIWVGDRVPTYQELKGPGCMPQSDDKIEVSIQELKALKAKCLVLYEEEDKISCPAIQAGKDNSNWLASSAVGYEGEEKYGNPPIEVKWNEWTEI